MSTMPESASESTTSAPGSFLKEVLAATPGDPRLDMCIQCGTCGGSCPSAEDMDHTPRQVFAMVRANMREKVLKSNTPWYCVSCYYCTVRCPQEVHITDLMYTLKSMAIKAKYYDDSTAPDFSQTFIGFIESFGRSFEMGLAAFHHLRHHPLQLPSMAPMALGLLTKGRLDILPHRIDNIGQLQAILKRAKEMEVAG